MHPRLEYKTEISNDTAGFLVLWEKQHEEWMFMFLQIRVISKLYTNMFFLMIRRDKVIDGGFKDGKLDNFWSFGSSQILPVRIEKVHKMLSACYLSWRKIRYVFIYLVSSLR